MGESAAKTYLIIGLLIFLFDAKYACATEYTRVVAQGEVKFRMTVEKMLSFGHTMTGEPEVYCEYKESTGKAVCTYSVLFSSEEK